MFTSFSRPIRHQAAISYLTQKMASICLSYDPWLHRPQILTLASAHRDMRKDYSHLYALNFKQQMCYGCRHPTAETNRLALLFVEMMRGSRTLKKLLLAMLKNKSAAMYTYISIVRFVFFFFGESLYKFSQNNVLCFVKCQPAECKTSLCEKRKPRPLISWVSFCCRTGRSDCSAAIRNQPNSPPSHPCPCDTLSNPHLPSLPLNSGPRVGVG